jgi:hypothetical protein
MLSGEGMDVSARCEQCGAQFDVGEDCQSLHEWLVGYDFDPDNAVPHAIHFLQVTCFMVQHDRYSDEALGWAQAMLRAHLEGGMDTRRLRKFVTSRLAGAAAETRAWRFQRASDARPLPRIAWQVTIADVARRMRRGDAYDEIVTLWARTMFNQMSALLVL